jgi:hypothetical protein
MSTSAKLHWARHSVVSAVAAHAPQSGDWCRDFPKSTGRPELAAMAAIYLPLGTDVRRRLNAAQGRLKLILKLIPVFRSRVGAMRRAFRFEATLFRLGCSAFH